MKRRAEFIAHPDSGDFLKHINKIISIGEEATSIVNNSPPIFLIVGPPRSGTTVLTQWLANIGFAVPSNIAARFYENPYFAGLIQRLLSDPHLNYRDELTVNPNLDAYHSNYGKTKGLLSPHEFSYYFRKYFPTKYGEKMDEKEISQENIKKFAYGLEAFGSALNKPVALKGLLIQYNLELFFPYNNFYIIHSFRDEIDNICSLYKHRSLVADDEHEWISVRPPEYRWLQHRRPLEQVAGQIYYTNKSIRESTITLNKIRYIPVEHDAFCKNPKGLYDKLQDILTISGCTPLPTYKEPSSFTVSTYQNDTKLRREAEQAREQVINRSFDVNELRDPH